VSVLRFVLVILISLHLLDRVDFSSDTGILIVEWPTAVHEVADQAYSSKWAKVVTCIDDQGETELYIVVLRDVSYRQQVDRVTR